MKRHLLFILMALPLLFTSCSKDKDEIDPTSRTELVGTWYNLEGGWILSFAGSTYTQYEFYQLYDGDYTLNDYPVSGTYSISGNSITVDGETGTIKLSSNTFTITYNGESLTYTKFDGTPQQLIEYLNKKA